MRWYRKFAAVSVGLLAGSMLVAGAAQAAPDRGEEEAWSPTLLSSEPLYDGSAVRMRYTDGITVVASAGAKVVFLGSDTPAITADGKRVYDRAVRIVDSTRRSSAAKDYAASGRSVYTDALAAGFSPAEARQQAQRGGEFTATSEPPILASGCVYSEEKDPDPAYEWSGCYKLYDVYESDPEAWYAAASGTARGWGTSAITGGKELQTGYTLLIWDDQFRTGTVEVIEASPPSNQAGANCGQYTISLQQIFGISYTVPLCDDGWNVTWPSNLHKVEWHGASAGGEDDLRHASGASTVRIPSSHDYAYYGYQIGWSVACFSFWC